MSRFRTFCFSALFAFSGGLVACGPSALERAETSLARGDLATATYYLEGEAGFPAQQLRKRIAVLAADREAAAIEAEECLALANTGEKREALKRLEKFKRGLRDKKAKDVISQAESDIVDLVPRSRPAAKETGAVVTSRGPEPEPASGASLAERSADQAERAAAEGDWKRALSLVEVAVSGARGEEASSFAELRNRIREDAARDAKQKLQRARELESSAGLDAALRFARNVESMMPSDEISSDIRALREFSNQAGGSVAASSEGASPGRTKRSLTPTRLTAEPSIEEEPSAPRGEEGSAAMDRLVAARRAEEEGRILEALDAYRDLTLELPVGSERNWAYERSLSLEDRAALREELSLSFAGNPDQFIEWGVTALDGDQVTIDGEERALAEVPLNRLKPMIAGIELTSAALAGWFRERLSRDDESALRDLGRATEREELSEEQAWTIVAEARDEERPASGYQFEGGEWHSSAEAAAEALASQLAAVEKALVRARPEEREAALKDALALGADGLETLKRALAAREEQAVLDLTKGRVLDQLERLGEQRTELDEKREAALELIFDEEEYFYPYNPPECPPERAKLYPGVQRRVDELVAEVRGVWQATKSVRLNDKFTEALAELDWLTSVRHQNGFALVEHEELPEWIAGLPRRAEKVDLTNFGWNAKEGKDLRYGRAVRAFNEAHWKSYEDSERASALGEISIPSTVEQEQVRATNDYRVMFGRRPVAWNPVVQVAAQGHSDWMSLTGKYSHFNDEDPKLRGPGDRMRVAGYNRGISENLSRGNPGPRDAHDGWAHSSGHHRNLLMPGHREMASALAGSLWTQNFGVDDAFVEALEEWYD